MSLLTQPSRTSVSAARYLRQATIKCHCNNRRKLRTKRSAMSAKVSIGSIRSKGSTRWIGFLNHLFYERRYIASAPSLSSTAELSKSCGLVGVLDGRVGGGAEIAGARGAGDRAGRSNSERAAPSACVGRRFSAPQIVWNRSTRRAGARGEARVGGPRCLRILTITGGSSMAAMIFKAPPQFGQCSMSKTSLSSIQLL